jgi:hypothetical protein
VSQPRRRQPSVRVTFLHLVKIQPESFMQGGYGRPGQSRPSPSFTVCKTLTRSASSGLPAVAVVHGAHDFDALAPHDTARCR